MLRGGRNRNAIGERAKRASLDEDGIYEPPLN